MGISMYRLPIESLREKGIERCMRVCKLCDLNTVCTEFHALMECTNPTVLKLRHTLNEKIKVLHFQWNSMSAKSKFLDLFEFVF